MAKSWREKWCKVFLCFLTLLLLSSFSSVTNLDCADADDDGHDEEEDAANEARCDGSSLDILGHGVPSQFTVITLLTRVSTFFTEKFFTEKLCLLG